ncbi:3-methyladenine DNA glycosylase [[Mycobacterium] wendilense]|uniref:3-methyladenine DNA glycosylase n=1 Tax=[Mycobacterium] wendilense TaxID=3064284 RepID=A0ABN9P555_9MYCO|nr:3-methyladenine DNA glycosylase [Mycolicibacterium sp. MU0050]CAJ1582611.1 3-methyladenine DNA glycosylase [Mycolicibacterium sp. MU0050]
MTAATNVVLPERVWTERAEEHRRRVESFLAAHSGAGQPHPVWDFLFTYYSLRPRQLLRWHPGYGTVLAGPRAREYSGRTGYVRTEAGVTVGSQYRAGRLETIGFIEALLSATAERTPQLNCFGLHEWAMVYRSDDVRHAAVPLRLGQDGTDAVVEAMPLRCSHYDAYRFFTAPAAPRNATRLTRATQLEREQPGCVHTNMDLYKWAYKLMPLLDSALLLDCLDLAAEARELDMRASPYDLRGFGLEPLRVEDPAGRAEYVRLQAEIGRRAVPLRAQLIDRCRALLAGAEGVAGAACGNSGAVG